MFLAVPSLSCGLWGLVPWPGIKPEPPALGAQNLSHWTMREVFFLNLGIYSEVRFLDCGWFCLIVWEVLCCWLYHLPFPRPQPRSPCPWPVQWLQLSTSIERFFLKKYFIKKYFIILIVILLFLFFGCAPRLVVPYFPTRDQTYAPCVGSSES